MKYRVEPERRPQTLLVCVGEFGDRHPQPLKLLAPSRTGVAAGIRRRINARIRNTAETTRASPATNPHRQAKGSGTVASTIRTPIATIAATDTA